MLTLISHKFKARAVNTALAASIIIVCCEPALSQHVAQYSYSEVNPASAEHPLMGYASYKVCQIKNFMFAIAYVFAAIAFVVLAVRALFTKFEMKHFSTLLAAVFVVATADLFIAFLAPGAYYCPSLFTQIGA